jgi:ankyrin repeat protein
MQAQGESPWTPEMNFSASNGQSLNNYDLPVQVGFPESLAAPYIGTDNVIDFLAPQCRSLQEAISHGTEGEVNNLLSSGISVSSQDHFNNSPLHTAIMRGDISIVKALLNYGADVDAVGFKGKAPLHMALASKEMTQLLVKYHPVVSSKDDEGNTALHLLLQMDRWWLDHDVQDTIKLLVSSGADINIANRLGESPLHRIVAHLQPKSDAYIDMLVEFLDYRPNVTLPMRTRSLLFASFVEDSLDNISFGSDKWGREPHISATFRCLKRFLEVGANPNTTYRGIPLLNYCLEKSHCFENDVSWELLELLLQKADIEIAGPNGNYPIHCALIRKENYGPYRTYGSIPTLKITKVLIERKANVNHTNAEGATPLELWFTKQWRISPSYVKGALLLMKAGAVITRFTSTGSTLFDLLGSLSRADRTALTKTFLEAAITSRPDPETTTPYPAWVEIWRSAWKEQRWVHAKDRLVELGGSSSRPSSKEFHERAFVMIAEHLLEIHKAQLKLWHAGYLEEQEAANHREEYLAILRDCRQRKAAVDASWYAYLLDILDSRHGRNEAGDVVRVESRLHVRAPPLEGES